MEHLDPVMGIIIPYINFAIFIGAAIYFFRKPVTAFAAKKRTDFAFAKAEAERAKIEAVEALQKLETRMASIQSEIDEIRSTAKRGAEMEAAKIIESAESLAIHLQEEAKRIAANEVEKARQSLREEVIKQVKESVTSRIRTDLNSEEHNKLVQTRIGKLKEVGAIN